ncbi:MAG: L-serine ammonia-lyase [Saprospiraceae bacterium]|nr:L-serine ammonia-lyase [Saprospiraceae bacterium]
MGYISVFDVLKIGVGPSSSHTLGPWKAALQFLETIAIEEVESVSVHLFGSLALTGKGHGTDIAVMMGLSGHDPKVVPVEIVQELPDQIKASGKLSLGGKNDIAFDYSHAIQFHFSEQLTLHPNGIRFIAFNQLGAELSRQTYFSVGGGFVVHENDMGAEAVSEGINVPYDITSADDLEAFCMARRMNIAELAMKNELHIAAEGQVRGGLNAIWEVMRDCMFRGCHTPGLLPGGLNVRRRASDIYKKLASEPRQAANSLEWFQQLQSLQPPFNETLNWISCFAMAINEENANFGRVVTAPTNGAAGVIPAVLAYYVLFSGKEVTDAKIQDFLLVCGVIGTLFKNGATISAAMGGCQAEIGVSSAMAAAALTEGLGGNVGQSLMAAEIAMEHHLGLTCDPVKGLVQVPCIERNSMGAIKAITAANLALASDPEKAKVSLDEVIQTMWHTAQDMHQKYKETSLGGLATNIAVIVPEC